jgi:hypothetical protein
MLPVSFIGFDSGFVYRVAHTLTGKNDLIPILSGYHIPFVAGGQTHT